jgi:hypothetical protein
VLEYFSAGDFTTLLMFRRLMDFAENTELFVGLAVTIRFVEGFYYACTMSLLQVFLFLRNI